MNLQEKLLELSYKHPAKRQVVMRPWNKIHSIVLLTENHDIQSIIKELTNMGKQVDVFSIPDKNDICWFTARPKAALRKTLQTRCYDLLIDLTQQPNITMMYMVMYIQAGLKTGRHTRNNLYDLTIDTPIQEKPDFLYEQIVKYIQMFTQNEKK